MNDLNQIGTTINPTSSPPSNPAAIESLVKPGGEKSPTIESEMKFSLDEEQARKLLKCRLLRKPLRDRATVRHLTSTYYDTRQHVLRNAAATLRIRVVGDRCEQTLKVAAQGPPGMQNNEEWNVPSSDGEPDLGLYDKSLVSRITGRSRRLNLQPVFTSEIQRTALIITRGKTRVEMALDTGEIHSHGATPRRLSVREVEFELLQGSAVAMLDFILELCGEIDLVPLYLSKAQRGYALARPSLRPKPAKARRVALTADMSVGQAFQAIVAESLRHLSSSYQPTLEGSPAGVHQSRVSIRRIRAALRAFKKSLPYVKRKAFNGEFRWFQGRLSPARDWHVFLCETLPQIRKSNPHSRISPGHLDRAAINERRRATAEVRELLMSKRFTHLMLEFQRWLLAIEVDNRAMFERKLRPFARGVLDKTRRDFLLDTRPLSRMSEEDRHNLRKRGKKARYATEFFSGLWEGPQVDSYLKLMEKVQDRLGKANDAVVARHMLANIPPELLKPSTIWRVQKWSGDRVRHNIKTAQPLWRKMKTATPFWLR